MKNLGRVLVVMLVICVAACGGGGGTGSVAASQPLLAGDPLTLAVNALSATGPVAAGAAEQAGDLLLTRISVTLDGAATVEQFNAAASAVDARGIAFAEPGSPFLTLIVPRQPNGAALLALAERLQGQAGVLFAAPGRQLAPVTLPGQAFGTPQSSDLLQHLLPTRFPAAWNAAFDREGIFNPAAQNCTPAEATVIVVDFFQSQPAAADQLDPFAGAQRFGAFQPGPVDHGWQVAAVLAGAFDEIIPTGALPLANCVDFVLVDVSGLTTDAAIGLVKQAIAAQPPLTPMIVNSSLGFGTRFCGANINSVCSAANLDATPTGSLETEIASRITAAILWAEATSDPLDQRLLGVQAAGNEANAGPEKGDLGPLYPGIRQADLASPMALATRLDSLELLFSPDSLVANDFWTSPAHPALLLTLTRFQDLQALLAQRVTRLPSLTNLLLVGSATNGELPADVTESAFSNEGSSLLAVGEAVVGLGGHLLDGTSFAAPQVAGLAAYLWSISPLEDQPARETAVLIKATTTPTGLLDAYAATLALDVQPSIPAAGIRESLLDVTGDGVFDEQDLQRFEDAYGLDDPNTPSIPLLRDYGRFDLNGDGATGGVIISEFDLDRDALSPLGRPLINTVDREIEGYPVTFNEAALSDIQILCYYAYSTLYAGTSPSDAQVQFRTAALGPDRCVSVRMNTLFPTELSGPASLAVTVEVPSGSGQFAPAANLLVTFTPSCGTVNPASGRTDASGNISTTVTAADGCPSVSVAAVASSDVGTTVLAQKTVSAAVPAVVPTGFAMISGQAGANSSGCSEVRFVPGSAEATGLAVECPDNSLSLVLIADTLSGTANTSANGVVTAAFRMRIPTPQAPGSTFTVRAEIQPAWFSGTTSQSRVTISSVGCVAASASGGPTAFYETQNGVTVFNDLVLQGPSEAGFQCLVDVGVVIAGCSTPSGSCTGSGDLIRFQVTAN